MTQQEVDQLYEKPFLTVNEVAQLLDISNQSAYDIITRGTLKYYTVDKNDKFGTHRSMYKVPKDELISYVLEKRRELLEKLDKYRLPSEYA